MKNELLIQALNILNNYTKNEIEHSLYFGCALRKKKETWRNAALKFLHQNKQLIPNKMSNYTIQCTTHNTFIKTKNSTKDDYCFLPHITNCVRFDNENYANHIATELNEKHPELTFIVLHIDA